MIKLSTIAAAAALFSATGALAAEPITSDEMCQARLETHKNMLASSDAGPKANKMVEDLVVVFANLCQSKSYDDALRVGDTIRGLLASEN